MKKRNITIVLALIAFSLPLTAQTLSLKQCIEYAKQNNSNMKIASMETEKSGKKVSEQIGKGLPQIDVSSTLTNNLDISTSLLPGALFGSTEEFVPVKMGTKYTSSNTLSLTQKIFDASFWVGLSAAKLSDKQSELSMQQTEEMTSYNVSIAYYRALVVQKQFENLKVILDVSQQALTSTELRHKNGMAKKIDVDKIRVSYNNTRSQLQQTEMNEKQALNNLKYAIGMPVESAISLSDSLTILKTSADQQTMSDVDGFKNRFDYQLQEVTLEAQQASRNNNIAEYFPTLSFFANYNYNAMRQDFDVFQPGKDWYKSSAIGLTLKIPIFSGFQRLSRVGQAQVEVEQAKENIKLKEQAIKVEISNYEIQYKTALENIENERENLALAESVYENTQMEFKQGTSSTLELVQAESSLRETQNNYYTKLLTLYTAKLDKEKANGTLINFINNLE
jgi:outer membrane protein TolC